MAVHRHGGTPEGAVTPICGECGVSLCWDISRTEYLEAKAFWDGWTCQDCNGSRMSARAWSLENGAEALPDDVAELVSAFALANGDLATAHGAEGRSEQASRAFSAILARAGHEAPVLVAAHPHGRPHHVVSFGAMSIDWTATAHDADAPFPLVHRTSLGWPIEPEEPADRIARLLAGMTPGEMEALVARIAERRRSRIDQDDGRSMKGTTE